MGSGFSHLFPCLNQAANRAGHDNPDLVFTASEPLDEALGHSFCYVRSSARFLSPTPSDRFLSPTHSFRFSPSHEPATKSKHAGFPETGFRAISGASVSANTSTPRTVLQLENIYDDAIESVGCGVRASIVNGFESTSSFCALPLQPVPRGGGGSGGEPSAFFMSGPIERGALSGPLESDGDGVPFSAPLGGAYVKTKRNKGISGIRNALSRKSLEKKRPWVVPVRNFVGGRKEEGGGDPEAAKKESNKVQWALGKAGEDRVHVVVSEEPGWLFVGIYDGFNGPDAPEFLMGNLYRTLYKELDGLFWDSDDTNQLVRNAGGEVCNFGEVQEIGVEFNESQKNDRSSVRNEEIETGIRGRKLWEFLAEDHPGYGSDLPGSDRFAFSVDDAPKNGLSSHKESRNLFPWRFWLAAKEKNEVENIVEERHMKGKVGPVDHDLVLGAMSRALEVTELAYLDMTHKVLDQNPELALMGSCLLVVLMRDEDVYVMNVGDSRAIVAQYEHEEVSTSAGSKGFMDNRSISEDTVEESTEGGQRKNKAVDEIPAEATRLSALQLSTDHSTSIEEEIVRIKNEHPDDSRCIVNDRVKGRLKVTRAFGAGFLKQPKLNNALLEMFRNEFIGTAPYISCSPSLRHHKLCPRDHFLVLSSDGLYQYLSNQEVVSHVESFMEKFPDGDPAQHLIEELLQRAATKAGMELHELLDIPQGDRRKYHDDVTVMVISLEGRILKWG